MHDWMRHLKRAIEQIRNNNRTNHQVPQSGSLGFPASAGGGGASPRQTQHSKAPSSVGQERQSNKDKAKKKDDADPEDRRSRKKEDLASSENKENVEDWYNSKERKQKNSVRIMFRGSIMM